MIHCETISYPNFGKSKKIEIAVCTWITRFYRGNRSKKKWLRAAMVREHEPLSNVWSDATCTCINIGVHVRQLEFDVAVSNTYSNTHPHAASKPATASSRTLATSPSISHKFWLDVELMIRKSIPRTFSAYPPGIKTSWGLRCHSKYRRCESPREQFGKHAKRSERRRGSVLSERLSSTSFDN